MKNFILTTILCFAAMTTFAQKKIDSATLSKTTSISGRVTDANTKKPIYRAMVIAMKDNRPFAGTTTDSNGDYSIKLSPGRYDMESRNLDYNRRTTPYINVSEQRPGKVDFELYQKPKKAGQ